MPQKYPKVGASKLRVLLDEQSKTQRRSVHSYSLVKYCLENNANKQLYSLKNCF